MSFPKRIWNGIVCAGLLAGLVNVCYAEESLNKVGFYGLADTRSGQFANYKFGVKGHELEHQWIQNNMVILGVKTQFHPRLQGGIGLLGWIAYHTFPDSMLMDASRIAKGTDVLFRFDRAEMTLNCSPDPEDSLCKITVGLFPYKYNKEVRNLGEYLFRTGCYPGYIMSDGFDMPLAQIAGIRVSSDLFNFWHNELLLTTELYLYPLNDFSLTYLTDVSLFKRVFNFGAAVQLYHCFPVNNDYTQPENYIQYNVAPTTPKAPNYYFAKDDAAKTDTLFYTFAGTKIMARFTFDPKPLLGMDIFGAEDLKLYSEAIILGVKNYPANLDIDLNWGNAPVNEFGYNKLMQKMPIMFGFNWPTHQFLSYLIVPSAMTYMLEPNFDKKGSKAAFVYFGSYVTALGSWLLDKTLGINTKLDVLSVEAEYYGKKYVNRVPVIGQGLGMMRLPIPYDPQLNSGYPSGDITASGSGKYSKSTYYARAAQWKWSIYAKKTLFNNFSITVQAARDHSRVQTTLASSLDQEEALIKDKQWCWMLKFGYSF